jgi:hypothetical protein
MSKTSLQFDNIETGKNPILLLGWLNFAALNCPRTYRRYTIKNSKGFVTKLFKYNVHTEIAKFAQSISVQRRHFARFPSCAAVFKTINLTSKLFLPRTTSPVSAAVQKPYHSTTHREPEATKLDHRYLDIGSNHN